MEFEQVSDRAEAENPMMADLKSLFGSSSYCGSFSFK